MMAVCSSTARLRPRPPGTARPAASSHMGNFCGTARSSPLGETSQKCVEGASCRCMHIYDGCEGEAEAAPVAVGRRLVCAHLRSTMRLPVNGVRRRHNVFI